MSSYTRQQMERWLNTIIVEGRIIDFGGAQKPLQGRASIVPGSVVDIFDLPQPHESLADVMYEGDINERYSFPRQIEQYDIAFCLEVMEYVWNPAQAINNIGRFLKKGGTLYMSTPFVYPVHNPVEQDYLRYTEHGIKKLLEMGGFEVTEYVHREAKSSLHSFYMAEAMRPSRDYKNHNSVGGLITAVKK